MHCASLPAAHRAALPLAFVALLLLPLPGCGGGGGGGSSSSPPAVQQATLGSQAALDGYVGDSRNTIDNGGLRVGDVEFGDNADYRAFVSFDLAALPPGAQIQSATLRLFQWNQVGSPYQTHGVVVVDHVDYGPALDGDDYGVSAILLGVGTLSSDTNAEYKTLDVTAQVQANLAGSHPRSQFRLRFNPGGRNMDGQTQITRFECADNGYNTGNRPQLVVTYVVP